MRKYFTICLIVLFEMYAKSADDSAVSMKIDRVNYIIDSQSHDMYLITIENQSSEDILFWISEKSCKDDPKEKIVHDFFMGRCCDDHGEPLLQLLYHQDSPKLTTIWKWNFIKLLRKNCAFFFLINQSEFYTKEELMSILEQEIFIEDVGILNHYGLDPEILCYPFDVIEVNANSF